MRSLAFLLLTVCTASAQEPANWHLLTKSRGGTVSLVKNLTERECHFMENRMLGRPATEQEKANEEQQRDAERAAVENACKSLPKDYQGGHAFVLNSGSSISCIQDDGKWRASAWTTIGPSRHTTPGDIDTAECFQ